MEMKSEPNSKSPGPKKFLVVLPYYDQAVGQVHACPFIMRAASRSEVYDRTYAVIHRDSRAWTLYGDPAESGPNGDNAYRLGDPWVFDLDTIIEKVPEVEGDDDLLKWDWAQAAVAVAPEEGRRAVQAAALPT